MRPYNPVQGYKAFSLTSSFMTSLVKVACASFGVHASTGGARNNNVYYFTKSNCILLFNYLHNCDEIELALYDEFKVTLK